ncbi:hypothetical protein [Ferruginibacter sp.]|nr:hypothetical protein [Ferruginibacter sp.]
MNKYKLHQWLLLLLMTFVLTNCSKKNYPTENTEEQYKNSNAAAENKYTPPQVITISDDIAKSNKEGELYYDNEKGYRYWRYCDGKYYLDSKYERGEIPKKKYAKKASKKQRKQSQDENYAIE